MKGKFIVFEGIDGSGKTSIAKVFYNYISRKEEKEPILTCEPYKKDFGNDIREIMKKYDGKVDPVTELLLFETSRKQHIADIILPALNTGKNVICDRFTDSTCAYPGFAMGIPIDFISKMNAAVVGDVNPDIIFWIDADINDCMARNKKAEAKDSMPYEYYEKCRKYYSEQSEAQNNFIRIDGNGTVDEVAERIINTYEKYFKYLIK